MRFPKKLLVAGVVGLGLIAALRLPILASRTSQARPEMHPVEWHVVPRSVLARAHQQRHARIDHQLHDLWQEVRSRFPGSEDSKLVVVDVRRQKLFLLDDGRIVHHWPVSTSIDGTDQVARSDGTPLGVFRIKRKLGTGLRPGAILRDQVPTGRIAAPVHAANDPAASQWITTRILWLSGLQPGWNEGGDVDTYLRHIYIHGTANLGMLGHAASHGCVQMAPHAVMALYRAVSVGTPVAIIPGTGSLAEIPNAANVG